ncbi:MAG: PAS domain-containing protein [Campylobacterota bacterium]|nr:PAS domain-containing protein [Campylobacterota bacterium]
MSKIIKNIITSKEIEKSDPIDEEIPFDGGVMITETDTAGIIIYANRKFREMTGFTREELIGSPHSINRHPDMPKSIFEDMWSIVKDGKYWEGYIKNMAKDGKYYLVIVWIKPKLDDNGDIIGYIAGRKIPEEDTMARMLREYKKMIAAE